MNPVWLKTYQYFIDNAIIDFFSKRYGTALDPKEQQFEQAIRYAVEGGGKRLRPILALIAYEVATGVGEEFWNTTAGQEMLTGLIGIEFIHCYTLVHDDLPSMDNDVLRRGKPTVWKKFGESMALLVGDTLQTMGFERIANLGNTMVIRELAYAIGDLGVCRGQVRDTFLAHSTLSIEDLLRIHDEKTGGFIAACLSIGGLLGGATGAELHQLRDLGMILGRAFQIKDDILDRESSVETLGKTPGKDAHTDKGIVSLIGMDQSRKLLTTMESSLLEFAKRIDNQKMSDVIYFVIHREQ